jgi:peptide/nickel transport system ATP-binding protein
MSEARTLIEVDNLRVRFGADGPPVVKGISFAIRRGECLALVGESGSGKSVTARTLVGLAGDRARIEARRLRFDDRDLTRLGERDWRQIRGGRIGFVMQDALGSLDPLRTAGREIGEALRLHTTLTAARRDARVVALLDQVGVPEPAVRARQYPHQLSGGLRQRALIASAIACEPELLLADEPTTALDATVQAHVLGLLESLRSPDRAMLIVSHDLAVVARLADRVAVMHAGLIVEQGPMRAVLHHPQHPYTRALLAAHRAVHAHNARLPAVRVHGFRENDSDRPAETTVTPLPRPDGDNGRGRPLLAARGLVKTYTGPDGLARTAVSDVSFVLRPGQTLGIVGESGSGKTTTARLMLGLEKPDGGSVEWSDRSFHALSGQHQRDARRRIQVVFQDPLASFDPRYTVDKILFEALAVAGFRRGEKRLARARELLALVRLDPSLLARRPLELSGGQRQRVAIARALATEPEVLVCDEPVSALDVSVQAQILDLLADLKKRLDLACLFISHDLGVIYRVCDRILVMKDGRVIETGAVREVFDRPQHPYTRTLLDSIPRLETPERILLSA